MSRASYKKWRGQQDFGIRPGQTLPAWNPGDQVEIIGTGLYGCISRCTTLDYSRWEIHLSNGKYTESHALNLRRVGIG